MLSAEAIAVDLGEIVRAVMFAPRPAKVPEAREAGWRYGWLEACIWGYCQTDLGVWHESGEDCSSWREDAKRMGIDLSNVVGRTWDERARDSEQRRLYAEAMGPRVAQQMLDTMRAREPSE